MLDERIVFRPYIFCKRHQGVIVGIYRLYMQIYHRLRLAFGRLHLVDSIDKGFSVLYLILLSALFLQYLYDRVLYTHCIVYDFFIQDHLFHLFWIM